MLRIIALSLLALLAFSAVSFGAGRSTYAVAASQQRYQVDLDRAECISIAPNRATIFGKDFFDNPEIMKILQAAWPGKQIYRGYANCPYVLGFTILFYTDRAVKYRGESSVVSMACQVCARKSDASVDDSVCSYKNLYLFRRDVTPLGAFKIGIKAFVQSQSNGWTIINVDVEGLGENQ